MKAAVYYENGAPSVFRYEDVPDPVPGPGEMLVGVEVISIEGGDTLNRFGGPLVTVPHIVGYQNAGTVLSVGADVDGFAVGDRVVALALHGSHAELRVAHPLTTWKIPDGLATELAACVPVADGTAHDGHAGGQFGRQTIGDLPRRERMRDSQLSVRAVEGECDDAVPYGEAVDVRSDAQYRSRVLVAHDVRHRNERSAESIQGVATFDADYLDTDEHLAGAGNRVRDVLVAKDARGTVFVIDGGFHRAPRSDWFDQNPNVRCGVNWCRSRDAIAISADESFAGRLMSGLGSGRHECSKLCDDVVVIERGK